MEISKAVFDGHFEATLDGVHASKQSGLKIITVPVELGDEGQPVLKSLEGAVRTLAEGLTIGDAIVLESSVPLGTNHKL